MIELQLRVGTHYPDRTTNDRSIPMQYDISDFQVGDRVQAFHPHTLGVAHWATVTSVGRKRLGIEWHLYDSPPRFVYPRDVIAIERDPRGTPEHDADLDALHADEGSDPGYADSFTPDESASSYPHPSTVTSSGPHYVTGINPDCDVR